MPPMQRVFLIILACFALIAAGCGDDSSTSTTPSPAETAAEKKKEKAAEAKEKEAEEAEKAKKAEEEFLASLPEVTVPKGPPPKQLVTEDLKQGSGKAAKAGDEVSVHYVGVLYKGGKVFDANWGEEDEPFTFKLGAGEVIKGWDQGVQGMKAGGERKLIIPPDLGYGPEGYWPSIPGNATLVFLVQLLKVK
jgi:FKBP-type peptidyl-prolyl cis-trans isomerase